MNIFKIARNLGFALLATAAIGYVAKADEKKVNKLVSTSPPKKLKGKMLFVRQDAVWVANLDGSGEQRLLSQIFKPDSGNQPRGLNPERTRLLYAYNPRAASSENDTTGEDLFDILLDGTGKRRITDTNYMLFSSTPRYSPNGKQIVYTRFTGRRMGGPGFTGTEIRIINSDGSNDHHLFGNLRNLDKNVYDPRWSLDGRAILFTVSSSNVDYSDYPEFKVERRIVSVDGRHERKFFNEWERFTNMVNTQEKKRLTAQLPEYITVGTMPSGQNRKVIFRDDSS